MYEFNYAPTVGLSCQEHRLPSNGMLSLLCDLLIMKAQPTARRAKWCSFWDVSWVLKKLNRVSMCARNSTPRHISERTEKESHLKQLHEFFHSRIIHNRQELDSQEVDASLHSN